MKYWEMIADNLSKAGWSWGCVATADSKGQTIWIVDAHRDNGTRFVARNEEKLTAFVELERVTRDSSRFKVRDTRHNSGTTPLFIRWAFRKKRA
jgi:hypothetical protein